MYVGNCSYNSDENSLRDYFGKFGQVDDVHCVMDRDTGRPRGFAFVTFSDRGGLDAALAQEHEVDGRQVRCNEAQDKQGGGGGGRGGGFGGGRGGGGGGGYGGQRGSGGDGCFKCGEQGHFSRECPQGGGGGGGYGGGQRSYGGNQGGW